jgi:hypothetical protein
LLPFQANSWGTDNTQYYPPIMSAWGKEMLGWLNAGRIVTANANQAASMTYTYAPVLPLGHVLVKALRNNATHPLRRHHGQVAAGCL